MGQGIERPLTFGVEDFDVNSMNKNELNVALPPLDAAEELDWLMSLALDDALEPQEAERLQVLLGESDENAHRWTAWQVLHHDFEQIPAVVPPVDFGDKFAQRLEIRERQRRLRTGVIFGVTAAALWSSALFGVVMLGALLWSNQAELMGGLIFNLAYWWAALEQFGQALWNTAQALWATPQARALMACYIVVSAAILTGWFVFLRRSTRATSLVEA